MQEEITLLLEKTTDTIKCDELRKWTIINVFIGTGYGSIYLLTLK